MIAPEIVTGTADNSSIHANPSSGQLDHTLRTEMTRSRQYSKIVLKRQEKPLDRRFLKKSIRYTGYYQQQAAAAADKESSESESDDCNITDTPIVQPTNKVVSSHDNIMGLIQSVESLSNFFDVPAGSSSNGSHELQPISCDPIQQSITSEGSSGYESMDSPTNSSTIDTATTTTTTTAVITTGGSRIKARKRTKPIPRPRQHRPAGTMTQHYSQTSKQRLQEGETVTTTFNPHLLTTCAAGIGCFGNDGGILTADNSKVTVNISEDSISLTGNPYIVQFEVCTDYRPSVLPTHAVSPLVHVKSSNTTFSNPITITIPHHVDNVNASNCVLLATKHDLTTQSSVEFTAFPVTKTTEIATKTSEMLCLLKEDHVSLSINSLQNFQWFMLTVNDEVVVRQCRVLVFHSRPKHGNFTVKVTVVEDYTDAVQVSDPFVVDMATNNTLLIGSHTSSNM